MTIKAISRRRVLTGAAAVSAAAILPRASYGSDWRPTETVRLIVPAAAGGSTDVMGRLLAAHLQTAWGQSAVVENRSGGGGTIGTAEGVRGKADGHVILRCGLPVRLYVDGEMQTEGMCDRGRVVMRIHLGGVPGDWQIDDIAWIVPDPKR